MGVVRVLLGLIVGIALFVVGIPLVQSLVVGLGLFSQLSVQEAALGILIVLLTVLMFQIGTLRPPPPEKS